MLAALLLFLHLPASGAMPPLLHYQGRVLVDGRVFDGTGRFKFALVNADGTQTRWRNAPDADANGEPDAAVEIPVARGLYALLLGDTRLAHMAPLTSAALEAGEIYLRVWFSDGAGPFERFVPDQQLAAAAFAVVAHTVEDGAITTAKLAPGAITPALVPPLDAAKIASGQLDPARLPPGVAQDADVAAVQAALTALTARVTALEAGGGGGPAGVRASRDPADAGLLAAEYVRFASLAEPPWREGGRSGGPPGGRAGHSAVWTGTQWVIWGGQVGATPLAFTLFGSAYRPADDLWADLPPSGLAARAWHTAVWTGGQMIVWGGLGTAGPLRDGARWTASGGAWSATALVDAPAARSRHVAAWVAGRMLVWGGQNFSGLLDDGGLYDPATDQWASLGLSGAPAARIGATAVVAGLRVLIWGGEGELGSLGTGAILTLNPDGTPAHWSAINPVGAPAARDGHTAVWTGTRMLVWGGRNALGNKLDDGGSYDPESNTWEPLPTAGAPAPRAFHSAVWTGSEMLVVAGQGAVGSGGSPQGDPLAGGGAYDPAAGRWRALTTAGSPVPRHSATAVWRGTELLLFGGRNQTGQFIGLLERLDPAGAWHLYRKP